MTYRVGEVRRRPAGAAGWAFRGTAADCGRRISPWLFIVLWLGNQTRVSSDIVFVKENVQQKNIRRLKQKVQPPTSLV